ncbi:MULTISPECIES: hypothetical protein [Staphylococcus]|uniref:hypothetical protein n=1 Tax=Staphylococcus TaxID=1279 RepID=UPI0007642021|nr:MULTISPECIES: hypothetical protein [Staphylococcus]KXA42525.1 hypothetical protein HMPREF3215_02137 [Staphylococcus simulans]OFM16531.1 hypothetical protein HMPREF2713_08040 [Staphylococcus sp. HMSC059E03]OFN20443.1 hypothetical protein HMPREF2603_07215 [Staphylococcus sp. HMSC055C03]OFV05433.1 hypothetical protein HMPREF3124_07780 [Staphylococcus sp. HMSC12H08]OHR57545.1 hypothetical protein HMPREF2798_09730 [Staphylococcus sp. HMSC070A03]
MNDSMFWKPFMIPVYLMVAFLGLLLFKFYIQANMASIILIVGPLIYVAIASIIYNTNRKRQNK